MKSCNNTTSLAKLRRIWFSKITILAGFTALWALGTQAQITFSPVFTNAWVLPAGSYADLPANSGNNVRGIAIDPVTTNVLYFSSTGGTNNGGSHVATVSFASGSNYLANLNSTGISAGTVGTEGVRVSDDGFVYGSNLSGSPASEFKIYKWPSDTDTVTAPTIVYDSGSATSFQWRIGDYMDLRGSGTNTEMVFVGNGSGANITTNFVIFRPTDATCTVFTNFSITIPGGVNNLCGGGVAFEGTNNAIWIRQAGSQNTRHIVYNPAALTATCDRTNTVDQSVCQGLKYLSYNGVNLLATVQANTGSGAAQTARVFQIPTSPTAPFISVLSASIPAVSGSVNGNGLGNVDARKGYLVFGAPSHGLSFFQLGFVTNSPPSTTVISSGSTIIQGYAATFTGTASGSTPLKYQWYFTDSATFTNVITGATTNIYTLASVQPTNSGAYFLIVTNLYGSATSSLASISVLPNGSSLLTTQLWSLAPGSRDYLGTSDTQRGIAYDTNTDQLILVSRSSTNGIHLLNADTGADQGVLDYSALLAITPPGTFAINMCGVGDDGVVYVGNLLTSATSDSFAIYSWTSASPTATINQAYAGNPGIGRIGDTMAVRGSGVNTEILCSFRTGTNVALFNTSDGVNFNFNLIAITNLPAAAQANGFAGLGLAFGPGQTFWAKSSGFDLRQVSYDPVNGVGGVINDYGNVPAQESAIGADNNNGYVAAIGVSEYPQSLVIYDAFASGGPGLTNIVDRKFFPTSNVNGNGTGSVAFDLPGGRIFALDTDNGIIALKYAGKVSIAQIAGQQVVTWPTTASTLQSATSVVGPYTNVAGATSPYTNTAGSVLFFRLSH